MKKRSLTKMLTYFFRGLLFTAPVAFTILVINAVFNWIDSLLPIEIPGLGLIIILVGITLIGYLAGSLLLKPIFDLMEDILKKLPLISIIYTSIKDLIGAFVGDKRKFNRPVMVKLSPEASILKPGFITQDSLAKLDMKDHVAVYLPHSYNFSGNLFIVPANLVTPWNVNATDAMKFIVSGGVAGFDEYED